MDIAPLQGCNSESQSEEEIMGTKRGPWSIEEDLILVDYIAKHGEGHWNSLARCAGLKRTGKSCRLRWLNYLRPDVRRGNITLEEQLLILELHSLWGNRWSKIAKYLPGRTDNEIKNYWRTRVQKQAKQLKCDVNSKQFKDTMQYVWMPRLLERIQASSWGSSSSSNNNKNNEDSNPVNLRDWQTLPQVYDFGVDQVYPNFTPEHSGSVDTAQVVSPAVSDMDCYSLQGNNNNNHIQAALTSSDGYLDFSVAPQEGWYGGNVLQNNSWNMDDLWLLEQQLCGDI